MVRKISITLDENKWPFEKNNLYISECCSIERGNYDCIIVPIISPFDSIRKKVRDLLCENFYLIYLSSTIESLKQRDPKGLYKKADLGEINNLIGYSELLNYDVPVDYDLMIETSDSSNKSKSVNLLYEFAKKTILDSGKR